MAELTPRPRAPGPVQAGPVVLLPPSRPGEAERRFAVRPARVLLLLLATFVAGAALAAVTLLPILESRRATVVAERDALRTRYEELQTELERLESDAAQARASVDPHVLGGCASSPTGDLTRASTPL